MNRSQLEAYAPRARRDFIQATKDRAAFYGLTAKTIQPVVERNDVAVIAGREHPRAVAKRRKQLEDRITQHGFEQTMESLAYTWFNRFVAIRYMELHGYLDHGYRVLSHPEGHAHPEILDHAAEVHLPGLDRAQAVELKLDGTQDELLYRVLLTAQCNALHHAMPFLFERIGDETELLLPANLLHTDSLIRRLVMGVDEGAWAEIEIIGWLYQFYVSEKKAQVIGRVVPSEDIPAATQLFTPKWIVQYLIQNSLGSQWLATYPDSPLKGRMAYYIGPAGQTDEIKAQLAAITPNTLNPEELTLIDPASGSGHILVEAYELFKAIYLERGYRQRDVARLILEKNLFGLDIDGRAAQLTGFALMMKGRADDQRLFGRGVTLNVTPLVDSAGLDAERVGQRVKLADYGLKPSDLVQLERTFEHATTFGSLIQVPEALATKLPALRQLSEVPSHDLFVSEALEHLKSLVQQAELLARQYDAVVANPPYMGSKFYCGALKKFVNSFYKAGKADLYASFTLRNIQFARKFGYIGMITIPNWMFLSSFDELRNTILGSAPVTSLVHNGRGVWGSDFGSCSYILMRSYPRGFNAIFLRLFDTQGSVASNDELERRFRANPRFSTSNIEFKKIPGSPVAYWVSDRVRDVFEEGTPLGKLVDARQGLATADNDQFVRRWHEVDQGKCSYGSANRDAAARSGKKWFPYNKGGEFRRWYGNQDYLVNWEDDGREIRAFGTENGGRARSRVQNSAFYFQGSLTWSDVTSGPPSFRLSEDGGIHDVKGMSAFSFHGVGRSLLAGYCNTPIVLAIARVLNPTVSFQIGNFANIPFIDVVGTDIGFDVTENVDRLVRTAVIDWNDYERSWDFQSIPILPAPGEPTPTLEASYTTWITRNRQTIAETKRIEEENNRLFIEAYGLADELTPEGPIEQITLTVNPAYRYGGRLTDQKRWTRFRGDTMAELISYAIGCIMGRYSLDAPGLIYARCGNEGFDPNRYTTFPADDDGTVPLTDTEWFEDDAVHRIIEFISVAWAATRLEDNLAFLADNLHPKANESSRDTIRRYLSDSFFTDHLTTYKKRPIYWLFSSGRQKAFQCLVYLHRYHDGTLARIRTKYVIPLQGRIASRIDHLEADILKATSTSHHRKLLRAQGGLKKQQVELVAFDEKLRHAADQKIGLDLDDGVKVNYGKFGGLLAEAKGITGGKGDA